MIFRRTPAKKKALFLLLMFLLISNSSIVYSQEIASLPKELTGDDLIAYYPFNKNTLYGNVRDESGNSNNGSVCGAVLTEDRFGKPDSAYSFDGKKAYIELSRPIFNNLSSWTWSGWVWSLNKGPCYSEGIPAATFQIIVPSEVTISIWNQRYPGKWLHKSSNTGVVQPNSWNHISITLERGGVGTGSIKYYINGKLESTSIGQSESNSRVRSTCIGKATGGNGFFAGKLDDIRIYKRALTAEEIKQLYNEGGWEVFVKQHSPSGLVAVTEKQQLTEKEGVVEENKERLPVQNIAEKVKESPTVQSVAEEAKEDTSKTVSVPTPSPLVKSTKSSEEIQQEKGKRESADNENRKGGDYWNQKEYNQAVKRFEKAVELEPTNATYQFNLAIGYWSLKNCEKALECLSKVNELSSNEDVTKEANELSDQIKQTLEEEKQAEANKYYKQGQESSGNARSGLPAYITYEWSTESCPIITSNGVELSDLSLSINFGRGNDTNESVFTGNAKNISSRKYSSVVLSVNFYKNGGDFIENKNAIIGELNPGEKRNFETKIYNPYGFVQGYRVAGIKISNRSIAKSVYKTKGIAKSEETNDTIDSRLNQYAKDYSLIAKSIIKSNEASSKTSTEDSAAIMTIYTITPSEGRADLTNVTVSSTGGTDPHVTCCIWYKIGVPNGAIAVHVEYICEALVAMYKGAKWIVVQGFKGDIRGPKATYSTYTQRVVIEY